MNDASRRDLVLAGPPGAGKTAAGRLAATLLGRPFYDLDTLVAERTGESIASLFARGESEFRRAERDAAALLLETAGRRDPGVVALGGGTLTDDGLADAFARTTTLVHLDAAAATLSRRLGAGSRAARPLLAAADDPEAVLGALRDARAPGYARACVSIDAGAPGPGTTAHRLLRALYDGPHGPWRTAPEPLAATLASARGVSVCRGVAPVSGPALLFLDDGLPAIHADAVRAALGGDLLAVHVVPAGARAKTAEQLDRAWHALVEARADRQTRIEVAGGGSVTDLGGFAAATYKRGVPLALRPTTLLAQLDAALGGKNGIDAHGIKNVAGTIRLPGTTHLDTLTLMTLPPRALRCGLAEAIKSALIGDPDLLVDIETNASLFAGDGPVALPLLERIVARAARVKLRVVDSDLGESGPRRALNLGHTVGHALEAAARAEGIDLEHGEAVAIGLVAAARLAARTGALADPALPERLEAVLAATGLPSAAPPLGQAGRVAFSAALAHDKKVCGGRIAWVLPRRAGEVVIDHVPEADAEACVTEVLG